MEKERTNYYSILPQIWKSRQLLTGIFLNHLNNKIMFNSDFYPTPRHVIELMTANINLSGKHVLEPSAGSGNIVDYALESGAKVIACETDKNLAKIIASKCHLIKDDFITVTPEEISHIDVILMNPPFSADEKHILHAWEIAPEGCQIVALCNTQTLRKNYTRAREKLTRLVTETGFSENLGNVFSTAERKTEVEVSMVTLFKPRTSEETEFADYFNMTESEEEQGTNGIMQYNEISEIVNRYVGAVKMFNKVMDANREINDLISPITSFSNIVFGAFINDRNRFTSISRDVFKKELQKTAWRKVFAKLKMEKYITQRIREDINSFIEKQINVPFTMGNIYRMLEMIVGTHKDRMNQVLVQAFERICSFAHSNNTAGEGWKTNSDYKINRRFIHPYICEYDKKWPSMYVDVRWSRSESIDDIVKALCNLTGKDYDEFTKEFDSLRGFYGSRYDSGKEWGQWYTWGFFRVRGYKVGTMHFEFVDEKVWELFNRRVAEIKGWRLPDKTDSKKKGTERASKQTGIVPFGAETYFGEEPLTEESVTEEEALKEEPVSQMEFKQCSIFEFV